MAEEFIPEGFEIVEENKEKEVIPGFEVVEKEEVAVEDAAPAATQNPSSTDSTSVDSSLESNINKLKKPDTSKKKKKFYNVGEEKDSVKLFNNRFEFKDWESDNKEKKRGKARILETISVNEELDGDLAKVSIDDKDYTVLRYDKVELPNNFYKANESLYEDKETVKINVPGDDPVSYERIQTKDYYVPVYLDENGNEKQGELTLIEKDKFNSEASDSAIYKRYIEEEDFRNSPAGKIAKERLEKYDFIKDAGGIDEIVNNQELTDKTLFQFSITGVKGPIQADPGYYENLKVQKQKQLEEQKKLRDEIDLEDKDALKIANDKIDELDNEISSLSIKQIDAFKALQKYRSLSPRISDQVAALEADIKILEDKSKNLEDKELRQNQRLLRKKREELEELSETPGVLSVFDGDLIRNEDGKFELAQSDRNEINFFRSIFADLGVKDGVYSVRDKKSNANAIVKTKPADLATRINDKFLNYSIGADTNGDQVTAFKNPVMFTSGDDIGRVNTYETAKNNGISEEKIKEIVGAGDLNGPRAQRLLREYLVKNGLAQTVEVGFSVFDAGDADITKIEDFANFIDTNKGSFTNNANVAYYQTIFKDPKQETRQKRVEKQLQQKANSLQKNITVSNNLIKTIASQGEVVTNQAKMIEEDYKTLERSVNFYNEQMEQVNTSIKELVEYTENKIAQNPANREKIVKEYNREYNSLKKEFDDLSKQRQQTIDQYEKDYTQSYKNYTSAAEDLAKYSSRQDEAAKAAQIALDDINLLAATNQQYDYLTNNKLKLKKKIYEDAEGEGNTLLAISKTFTDMLAKVSEGRGQILADVADIFNEIGYATGGINEVEYGDYKARIEADRKSFSYQAKAAAEVMKPAGIDDQFYRKWSDSTFGGTIQALTQMVAASFGAPVTGLFGGFFFSSLADGKAKIRNIESDFVSSYLENNPGASKREAKKAFDQRMPKSFLNGYAYIQATVEGAFAYVSGKIFAGGGAVGKAVVNKITNSILARLTGNVTARDIQVLVYKTFGNTLSKYVTKGGTLTMVGFEELIEETVQMGFAGAIDIGFEQASNLNFEGFDIFDKIIEGDKELIHMAKVSFLSGVAGGSINVLSNNKSLLTAQEETLTLKQRQDLDIFYRGIAEQAGNAENLTVQINKLNEQYNEGYLTIEEFNSKKLELQKNYEIYSDILTDTDLNGRTIINVATLTKQKNELQEKADKMKNKSAAAGIKEKIDAIDAQIKELVTNQNNKRVRTSTDVIQEQLQTVIDIKNEGGANIQDGGKIVVFNKANAEEIAKQYNIPVESLIDENGEFSSEGSYLPDQGVILMSEEASKGVDKHEGSHIYFDQALNAEENQDVVFALADTMLDKMKDMNPKAAAAIEKQLNKYKEDPNYNAAEVAEEVLTYYAQLKDAGAFDQDKTLYRQVMDYIQKMFRNIGLTTMTVTEDNIDKIIDDYVENVGKGKLSRAQKKFQRGEVKFDQRLRDRAKRVKDSGRFDSETVVDTEQQQEVRQAAAKPINVDTVSMSNAFDQNLTNDLKTNDDFKNSMAAIDAFDAIENNSNFNSYINQLINRDSNLQSLNEDVRQDVNRKIKENLQLRVLKNFKPELDGNKRSLFSFIYGKKNDGGMGGIAFRALQDIKKEYATRPDAGARSTDATDSEGRSFDIADTSTDIIADVDRGVDEAPKSTFRRNIKRGREKGLTPKEVKEFEEISEPLVDKLPDVNAKDYRTKVNKIAGPALKKWVNDNIFKNNWGEEFLLANYNNIRDLGIDYLIDLDKGLLKQGKPRMFTKFNKKLTTQAEIRKYRDSGRAFVENEAQGVSLFDILDPGAQAMADFYLKDSPSNRSNRKGKLAEAFGKKMFKDVQPQIRDKRGDSDQVKATSARKTQVQPTLKFAKKFDNKEILKLQQAARWKDKREIAKNLDFNSDAINESNREALQTQILEAAKQGFIDKAVIEAGAMGSGGRQTFYGDENNKFRNYGQAKKAGIKNIGKYFKTKDNNFYRFGDVVVNKRRKVVVVNKDKYKDQVASVDPSLWIAKPGRLFWGTKDPAYETLLETANDSPFDENGYRQITISKKGKFIGREALVQKLDKKVGDTDKTQSEINMDMLDHVVNQLAQAVDNGMSMDIAGMVVVQSYQATGGLIKVSAPFEGVSDFFEAGKKLEIRSEKLYREEHNPPASVVGASILTAIKMNKPKAVMADIRKNFSQTILSKKDDSLLDIEYSATLPEGVYIGNNPIIRMAMAGINLNTVRDIRTGQSYADKFGLGVAETVQTFPGVVNLQNKLIEQVVKGELELNEAKKKLAAYAKFPNNGQPSLAQTQNDANKDTYNEVRQSKVLDLNEEMDIETLLSKAASVDEALRLANSLDQPVRKIRVFDFDDTLATSNNIVYATKGDETISLNAEQFASRGLELKEQGWTMDFSDFNKVTDGGRGPLFDIAKKIKEARGNEDLFVLTARAPESADAIYEFLKAEGLEFKRSNIIGLGNSTGEAKANWIVDKAAEGYNDFYFADDAYQNVRAVKDALSVIDVKSKVQQARIKESKKLSDEFNNLLEETTGIEAFKEYSAAKAKTIGASKGKFKFFIPYSAEDFLGLVYPTLTKGSKGDAQMAWYKQNLLDPYTKAQENLSAARIQLMGDFKQLKKSLDVPKDLRKKNDSGFTNEQAVRVNLFTKMGYEIPGLSKKDLKELNDIVEGDPKLSTFSDQILAITKGDGYPNPDKNWLAGTITTDLINLINTEKRSKYLADWQERVDAIYTTENLNKLEAIYGTRYREALEGTLTRMRTGKNRVTSGNVLENRILDYINGSIGTIMFFNTRSAVLQTISSINFINWSFNNPLKAGQAFANQKQYWSDFIELMNSEYLVDRRNGLKLNISESEIADAAATSKNKAKAAINYLLQKGFLPTQYADSFAIASGGATFYRNRIKDLVKNQGMTEAEAKAQALIEFRQVSEQSQQSSDPSRISQQQASSAGRLILAFANTPMQYARLQKRAIQDLVNGRGDAKSHISRIIYYGFVQNVIFNALQQAVNIFGFGDDEEEDPKKEKKYLKVANSMLDSLLRGLGIGGAAVSVGKNFLLDIYERSKRQRPEYVDSVWKLTQFSPPINSKISRLKQAAWHFDSKKRRQKILDEGFSLNSPAFEAMAKVISATTNFPLDRVLYKIKNIEGALAEDQELWMRIAQLGGWPKWQLVDKKTTPVLTEEQKEKAKASKAIENYKAAKGSTDYDTLKKLTAAQQIKMLKGLGYGNYTIKNAKTEKQKIDLIIYKNSGNKIKVDKKAEDTAKYKALNKAEQVRKLDSLGLSKEEIKALKYEQDRVDKLLELMK